jgi:hypothetical protein
VYEIDEDFMVVFIIALDEHDRAYRDASRYEQI